MQVSVNISGSCTIPSPSSTRQDNSEIIWKADKLEEQGGGLAPPDDKEYNEVLKRFHSGLCIVRPMKQNRIEGLEIDPWKSLVYDFDKEVITKSRTSQ